MEKGGSVLWMRRDERAYVGAVAIADVGAVHRVSHQHVDKIVVQRGARLEESNFGKCSADIASDGREPDMVP